MYTLPLRTFLIFDFVLQNTKDFLQVLSKLSQASTLKGRNFSEKKISRTSAEFAKLNSFFDLQQCQFAKINSREIWKIYEPQILDFLSDIMSYELGLLEIYSREIFVVVAFAKIDSREILGSAQFAKINSREIIGKAQFA